MRGIIEKYIKYVLILVLIILAYIVVKPYITVIVTSLVLAYIAYPIHKKLRKKLSPTISAGILTIALFLIIVIPIAIFGNILTNEVMDIYQSYDQKELVTTLTETLGFDMEPETLREVDEAVTDVIAYMVTGVSSFLLSIPQKMINFVIMLFVFFYAFKDGRSILNTTMKAIPLNHAYSRRVKEKITTTIQSLLYGEIVISVIEGVIGIIGFMILGIGSPVLLGLLVALVALFPAIGPAIIWFPLTVYFFLIGETLKAIIIGIFGFFILSLLIDTIVRAKVLGMKGHIHPVIILVGVIGGIAAFGVIGLILGPLILVLLQLVFEIYLEQKNETQS